MPKRSGEGKGKKQQEEESKKRHQTIYNWKGKKLTKNRAKQSKSENFYQPKSFENNRFGFYPIYVL